MLCLAAQQEPEVKAATWMKVNAINRSDSSKSSTCEMTRLYMYSSTGNHHWQLRAWRCPMRRS
ncbi:hypothetical protein N7488_010754 [Penicillium malachiteum]|nr:hypothetical protein N7488_010754 [Penicillium malachiteum]